MRYRQIERRHSNPWRGLWAGALAGLVGSFAMSQLHSLFPKITPPASPKAEDSTVKAASAISRAVFHHDLSVPEKDIAGPTVHYVFGMGVGSLYGMVVEYAEPIQAGRGLPFGVAVHALTFRLRRGIQLPYRPPPASR
jgi:uncharacterized membrane protein YagU involved in acid resistance